MDTELDGIRKAIDDRHYIGQFPVVQHVLFSHRMYISSVNSGINPASHAMLSVAVLLPPTSTLLQGKHAITALLRFAFLTLEHHSCASGEC